MTKQMWHFVGNTHRHRLDGWTILYDTVCPRSSDPFYIVTYYIKWVTTSWTHSIIFCYTNNVKKMFSLKLSYGTLLLQTHRIVYQKMRNKSKSCSNSWIFYRGENKWFKRSPLCLGVPNLDPLEPHWAVTKSTLKGGLHCPNLVISYC